MRPFLFLPLLLGAMALVPFLWRGWRQRRARRAWLVLAPRLELLLGAKGDRRFLVGHYQDHPVEVLLASDGTARLSMKAAGSEFPAGLRLFPQESTPHRFRRPKEFHVGEPALDAAFIIQGQNPAAVIRLLREPDVGKALLGLHADNPRALLSGNEAVALLAYPLEEETCRRTLRSLDRVISALERASRHQSEAALLAREQALRDAPEEPSRPRLPSPPEKTQAVVEREIRAEFQRRVNKHLVFTQLPISLTFFLMISLLFPREPGHHWHEGSVFLRVGGMMGLLVTSIVGLVISQHKWMRCPACHQELVDLREGKRVIQAATDLASCYHCKT